MKQLGRFIRKSTCNFAIIKDMDVLLELFSDTLVSFVVKGERL